MSDPIVKIRQRLLASGYSGLVCPGECGCEVSDLWPCGQEIEDGDEWIGGCQPGHKHMDPRPGREGEWAIWLRQEPPEPEQWAGVSY